MTSFILEIRQKFFSEQFEFSKHAVDQSILRLIFLKEIKEAIENCEVIEDYPDDKYGPSCLVGGFTRSQRPIHVHCSYPSRPIIKIITLYEPDIQRWVDNFTRRRSSND
jgi:Domain of unknown function (DUF4258)